MERRARAGFRRTARSAAAVGSPRTLFRDLPREDSVPFLWAHQDRILERYEGHVDDPDLALELPTGTGKTLIGLLIAEWRRRSRGERCLYLCPTRQLAHQVGALASRYGIKAKVCLQPEYEGLDLWQGSDALAVSTYSSLFNFRPRFTEPQTLILDDAHAAEDYVASHWSVKVDRREMEETFTALAEILRPALDWRTANLLSSDEPAGVDRGAVELVPLPRWWPLVDPIRDLLDSGVDETSEWFAWSQHVREGIAACCLLVSWGEIEFRPVVPATDRQNEFSNAAQRIYMSATLGAGGELERIFGVREIERLPVPDEWEQRSTGRRLFLMPSASIGQEAIEDLVADSIKAAGRALVLAPTRDVVERRASSVELRGIETMRSSEIEESISPFVESEETALLLANRYDGIDLPGDDCRLLVLDGLPVAVNSLERFLYQRLAATSLLGERMRTRLTQGVGRATRGEGDWCAVLVASREAYDFCARGEVRALLHPELQGEVRFGLDQSRDREAQDFLDLLQVMLDHDEEWTEAEDEIRELRDAAERTEDPAAAALVNAVKAEVDFVYAMWARDFPQALQRALAAADALEGNKVAAYRAWWLYLAGTAAWLAHVEMSIDEMEEKARDCFGRASRAVRSVYWFSELAYAEFGGAIDPPAERLDEAAAERIQGRLRSVGFNGSNFSRKASEQRGRFDGLDSTQWEEGITELGRLLGFDSDRPGGNNDPDSVWVGTSQIAIAWEAKSEEDPTGEIGARTVQQAVGHVAWTRVNRGIAESSEVLPVLVSDRSELGDGADVHVDGLCRLSLDEVRAISESVLGALARARASGKESDDVALRKSILDELRAADSLPTQIIERIRTNRVP